MSGKGFKTLKPCQQGIYTKPSLHKHRNHHHSCLLSSPTQPTFFFTFHLTLSKTIQILIIPRDWPLCGFQILLEKKQMRKTNSFSYPAAFSILSKANSVIRPYSLLMLCANPFWTSLKLYVAKS